MNKILKRLLSVVLALVMVVTLVPLSGVKKVDAAAADGAANMTVYLQITDDWAKDNAAFRAYLWETSWPNSDPDGTYYKPFEPVSGETNLYSVTLNNKSCYMIKVARCTSDYNTEWNSFKLNFYERDNESVNKILVTGGSSGRWDGTYTPSGTGCDIPTDGIFYVDTDLVDYFNDSRVENNITGYSAKNQGDALDDMKGQGDVVPFSYFNGAISNLQQSKNYKFPLYFGALLFTNNRVGRNSLKTDYEGNLNKWSSTVNVALANPNPKDKNDYNLDASVQGLVDDTLGNNGELMSNGQELPYFSKSQASTLKVDGNQVMEYYEGFRFPFKSEYNRETGVTKYSYDSATDYAVYRNWNDTNDRVLMTSTKTILNNDETNGYYPLNKEGESGSAVNYGFGTKFTIPFTINENGTVDGTENGEPVTFSFTGDDDVWVFLDGKLILDMGGAHAKSTGTINFKDLTATVDDAATAVDDSTQVLQSGSTNVLGSYQNRGLTNYAWDLQSGEKWGQQERSTVSTSSQTINFNKYGEDYANSFKDSNNTHTLVMFYMERGMYDSNMKIEFTINPLPSGLSLSKSLNVADVNTGLVSAVQAAESDSFNFKIQTKDLTSDNSEESYSDVADLGYSLNNYNNQDTSHEATNSIITGVGARSYAHSFINTGTKKDAFKGGTSFRITEQTDSDTVFKYDYEKTTWTVYDTENDNAIVASYSTTDENLFNNDNLQAQFDMGTSESTEFERYDYAVNFNNTPKVGNLSLKKTWKDGQTAPENGEYTFTVLIDLDGESGSEFGYSAYTLDGDIADTDTSGNITLKADQTVTFAGIPVGASYKITENIPADANYTSDKTENIVTGTIEEDSVASVNFTNGFKTEELNKVIYIEAGRKDGTNYTLKDSDDVNITITGIESVEGITAVKNDDGTVNFKSDNAGMKYEVPYSGTKTDGTIVTGKITVFTYKATNKVYVFDYGLESDLTETNENHDGLFQDGVFYNDYTTGDYETSATLGEVNGAKGNSQTTITAAASVKIKDDGSSEGAVTFKPVAFMDKVENYTYTANVVKKDAAFSSSNPETGTVVNGTIEVMPANVVYYEDNFNADKESKDGTIKIIYSDGVETSSTAPTDKQSNDQSENYGHDDVYSDDLEASGGSLTTMTNGDGAYFTFKGTGFDIISRTNDETAGIIAYVYQGKKTEFNSDDFTVNAKNDVNNPLLKTIMVDTYYSNGDLYQVPVISTEMENYGEYTVYIRALQTYSGQTTIYIDGIRIYNPLDNNTGDYIATEKNVTVSELRDLYVKDKIEIVTSDTDGYYIVDGETAVEQYLPDEPETGAYIGAETVGDVINNGPNNELYLSLDNGIAFKVNKWGAEDWTLQIGAKSVSADNEASEDEQLVDADKSITVYVKPDNASIKTYAEVIKYSLNTSTDMYYDIKASDLTAAINNYNGENSADWPLNADYYDILILNTSDEYNIYDIVSFTTLKYNGSYVDSPIARTTISGYSIQGRNVQQTAEEVILSAEFNAASVTRGKYAKMTVVTAGNVEDLKVVDPTGKEVTSFSNKTSETDANGNKVWNLTFKVIKQKGEAVYQISAVVDGKENGGSYPASIAIK